MKNTPLAAFSIAAMTVGLSTLGLTGCNKNDRSGVSAKTGEMMADTKDAMSHAWDDAKSFTFEKRDDFRASAKAMNSKMEARLSDLRANYSEAKASASRKAAMAELKDSEVAYKEKAEALGTATADTWDSAKKNVVAAWDNLQASYDKARAD
jgi:major membrane immunogen (membrane-anchored lipoprotein)